MSESPRLVSIAFDDIPEPDFADVAVATFSAGSPEDPAIWAREVFSVRSAPLWVGSSRAETVGRSAHRCPESGQGDLQGRPGARRGSVDRRRRTTP